MSVSFARAVAAGLRAHGITVHYWPGWESRGNGQTSAYNGAIMHHTASGYGSVYAMLVHGRSDLSGPLCNSSGNDDGSVTIVAAHPANHAGASGGSWARPFPDTRNFNRMVWGHEIVYPGTSPMRPAQYHTAQILGGVIGGILRHPNPEWIRGHFETSITGKWDPGYAPGKWIDMGAFRAGIWHALQGAPAPAPAPPPPAPGGIETMGFNDTFTDWAGNQQTVQSWMNHLDQRLNELHHQAVAPGSVASRIPGDANRTNVFDMVKDNTSWTNQTLGRVIALQAANGIDPAAVADALRPVVAEVVGPVIEESVTAALGADNQAQADAIVAEIAQRLTEGGISDA